MTKVYAAKLNTLKVEFNRFAESQKFNLYLFVNPFAVDVDTDPEHLQLELSDLQCNDALKTPYQSVGAAEFGPGPFKSMPQLCLNSTRIMAMYRSTYCHETEQDVPKIRPHRPASDLIIESGCGEGH